MAETLAAPNLTRAGITGKVPEWAKPRGSRGHGRKKSVKLSGHQRKHVNHLKSTGQISPKAASNNGI